MSGDRKLKIAFLWHMHQPYYFDSKNRKFAMPWVRFHALKDYLDMPLLAAEYNIKATFNLVPSLLDQIELYSQGYLDRHQELSLIPAKELTRIEKEEILNTFFSAHFPTMIEPFPRYRQLYRKKESCGADIKLAIRIFSSPEWRDLQIWSNLVWIDPYFRKESPIKELYDRGRDYTEKDKDDLFAFQKEKIKAIIPTYKRLYDEGRIDISFTPYYHPILPLLIDSDLAREAIPDIELPNNRFRHPEDAAWHIKQSQDKFRTLFGGNLEGMWPSEGSVSESTAKMIGDRGLRWMATDEKVFKQSLLKSGLDIRSFSPHAVYEYAGAPGLKLFFRDHGLSDKIGFVYSGWETARAVSDFIYNLTRIKESLKDRLDESIVPIILDGENAWEYFPDDGIAFLSKLYQALAEHDYFEVVTLSEAAAALPARKLERLFAGSWINHNFKIWIGHEEDNRAWDLLYQTRKALEKCRKNRPGIDEETLAAAWRQIYIAEGSDWCWWYGDDHLGPFNREFDELYRRHLAVVYNLIKKDIPAEILRPIHRGQPASFILQPESLISPNLDGLLTHFYEWSGAGFYDCDRAGGAMHRVDIIIKAIYFAYDYKRLYIRLDFSNNFDLVAAGNIRLVIDFGEQGRREFQLRQYELQTAGDVEYCYNQIMEAAISREKIIPGGVGRIEMQFNIYSGETLIEKWPMDSPIALNLPEKDKEIFWQV